MSPIIRRLDWGLKRVPLSSPYHLSFATLTEYATVWVRFEDEHGRVGLGEAVPLPGYGDETLADAEKTVAALTCNAVGLQRSEVAGRCREAWSASPFSASAVMTALEFPELLEGAALGASFPLNWPLAGDAPAEVLRERMKAGLDQGYRYLKVKAGRDLSAELSNLPVLLKEFPEYPFRVLFDANQGFSPVEALAFAQGLKAFDSGRLCWFEQPLDRRDWDGLARLCAASPVPVILDESIYSDEDVQRAAAMGAFGVKLKLYKQCGPTDCLRLARLAKQLGLVVVFGNGVSTDIGNLAEYLILARSGGLFASPVESNGFCKLKTSLLDSGLAVEGGSLLLARSMREVAHRVHCF